jgi:NTE family protein
MTDDPRPPARRRALAGGLALAAAAAASARPRSAAAQPAATPPSAPAPRAPLPRAGQAGRGLAFALGSGSRHGLVHVGVIRAMQARGWVPDLVVGTSAGALAGALWALGLPADRIRAEADALGWLAGVRPAVPRRGLLRSDAVASLVERHAAARPIERWPVRFAAVATDLLSGRRVVLDRGPGGPAVAASACVPALYEPVRVDGRDLVDGSLVEPVPVRAARELGAARIVAVDIAYRPHEAPVGTPVDAAFQALHIAVNALIAEQIDAADLVIRLDVHRYFLEGRDPADALVAAGEAAVGAQASRIEALLGGR